MRRVGTSLVALLLSSMVVCTVLAAEYESRLFKEYTFGMSYVQVSVLPGVRDCSDILGQGALCLDGVSFLDHEWDMDFEFMNGRLIRLSLRAPFSKERYVRSFAVLDERFELVALQSGDQQPLDMVAQAQAGGAWQDVTRFEERGMAAGSLAYVFLERAGVEHVITGTRSAQELLAKADREVREAGLVLFRDEGGQDWLVMSFAMPHLEADLARTTSPGKTESF